MRARDKQRPTEKKKSVVLVLYCLGKNSEKPKRWVGEGGGGSGNQCLPTSRNFLPQLSNFPVFFLFCLDITN